MKSILKILFFVVITNCFTYGQKSVLVLPMSKTNISFDKTVVNVLDYNDVSVESAKSKAYNLSIERLSNHFSDVTFTNIINLFEYAYLIDSIDILQQWNTFHINKIDSANVLEKILLSEVDPNGTYYGRVINDKYKNELLTLINLKQFDYVFVINKFETITKKPFDNKTSICLHFEIYDKTMTKIYGNKSVCKKKIKKQMYVSVFYHYVQSVIDKFYAQITIKN